MQEGSENAKPAVKFTASRLQTRGRSYKEHFRVYTLFFVCLCLVFLQTRISIFGVRDVTKRILVTYISCIKSVVIFR